MLNLNYTCVKNSLPTLIAFYTLNFRSPGGTPIRERPRTPPPVDAASLIAAALKKRFARIQCDSPESDATASGDSFSSPPDIQSHPRGRKMLSPKKLLLRTLPLPVETDEFCDKPTTPPVSLL